MASARPKRMRFPCHALTIVSSVFVLAIRAASAAEGRRILVVGSINMDIIIDVERLPGPGETVTSRFADTKSVPGGKGANQAIAVSRLCKGPELCAAQFVCQFGNDAHAKALEAALVENEVDTSACGHTDKSSGQGLVLLAQDGLVSSVVVGGSNTAWPKDIGAFEADVRSAKAILLQREIPEHVNIAVVEAAFAAGVPVFQDIGGEDRPISDDLLAKLTFVTPNLSELARLTGMPTGTEQEILAAATFLQSRGAKNVLVTRGAEGALLVKSGGQVIKHAGLAAPGGAVVDETGAGDSFRAAFVVAFVEGRDLSECLQFAAAAGAIAVTRRGAVPSLPHREECSSHAASSPQEHFVTSASTCGSNSTQCRSDTDVRKADAGDTIPVPQFGSRLNSMGARSELWDGADDVLGWVARQGTVKGLNVVDFNFPQHFASGITAETARKALEAAGLKAGAIGMRYTKEYRLGAFSNPDADLRRKAIALTVEGGAMAKSLGADELVIWSAFDGYDYPLQIDYATAWNHTVEAFREVCDAHPDLKVSIEHKPTDASSRYSVVGSAGAARLLVEAVGRSNMGVTIDVGHCIMAGENPAQSIAIIGDRLFGVHLNDGHSRIGAEDGLMVGTVHHTMTLELMYWLQNIKYKGHLYMDTFPANEDPVRECEFNIRRASTLWQKASRLRQSGLDALLHEHDALGVLETMERLGDL